MNRHQITENNIKETSTDKLVSFYYPTKDDIEMSKGLILKADTDKKEQIARGYLKSDTIRYNLILNELKSRGIKKVKRTGEWS